MRRRMLRMLAAAAALALAAGCGEQKKGEETLTLTVVPYEAAQKLNEEYGPLADYLAKRTGKAHGKFVPVTSYLGVVAGLKSGQVDVAYLSSFPYVLAQQQMKLPELAMPSVMGSLMYRGIIFVRKESPIRTLQDLKGKSFAFGDVASTTGYILPRALLVKNGVAVPKPGATGGTDGLLRTYNAGDANMVVKAVEGGTADAGAVYDKVWMVAYRDAPEGDKVKWDRTMRVIATTESIPNGIYVARPDMPAAEVEKLRQAFMSLNTDPQGKVVMQKATNDKEVPPDDKLFEPVRQTALALKDVGLETFDRKK